MYIKEVEVGWFEKLKDFLDKSDKYLVGEIGLDWGRKNSTKYNLVKL